MFVERRGKCGKPYPMGLTMIPWRNPISSIISLNLSVKCHNRQCRFPYIINEGGTMVNKYGYRKMIFKFVCCPRVFSLDTPHIHSLGTYPYVHISSLYIYIYIYIQLVNIILRKLTVQRITHIDKITTTGITMSHNSSVTVCM